MKQLLYRIIYQPQINFVFRNINKLLYPILPKKVKLPPSGTIVIKNQAGKKLKIHTNQTNYLTQLIYWEGYENFEYTKLFVELVKKVKGFYDVGANIGYYSLLAALENPTIKVTAFEPAKGPLHYLKTNVNLNNFSQIKVESLALSQKEGDITFHEVKSKKYTYLKHNLAGTGSEEELNKNEAFDTNVVQATSLDNYYSKNPGSVDLIKIDTEGTEHLILESGEKILSETNPIFICETLFLSNEAQLESIFKKHGYEFYNHYPEGLRKTDTIIRSIDNGVRNCFFVHPSKKELIDPFLIK
ncbi:FkbM family methyltransferase [Belliella marina]|uniref:FkbM family methyltransferase n=1 Tax=Belliella marina TaxID=1644146 RepID=A0ABW4VTD1_9BACT